MERNTWHIRFENLGNSELQDILEEKELFGIQNKIMVMKTGNWCLPQEQNNEFGGTLRLFM